MAVSFIPIAGPLISCIIDGTFVDMWAAICAGDWKAVALAAVGVTLAGIGIGYSVAKLLKTGKAVGKIEGLGTMGRGNVYKEGKLAGRFSHEVRAEQMLGKGKTVSDLDTVAKNG